MATYIAPRAATAESMFDRNLCPETPFHSESCLELKDSEHMPRNPGVVLYEKPARRREVILFVFWFEHAGFWQGNVSGVRTRGSDTVGREVREL